MVSSEETVQRSSLENVLWKYTANLQENTHAEVRLSLNTGEYGSLKTHKVTIKDANFFVLIVSRLRTHQRKNFTLNN